MNAPAPRRKVEQTERHRETKRELERDRAAGDDAGVQQRGPESRVGQQGGVVGQPDEGSVVGPDQVVVEEAEVDRGREGDRASRRPTATKLGAANHHRFLCQLIMSPGILRPPLQESSCNQLLLSGFPRPRE